MSDAAKELREIDILNREAFKKSLGAFLAGSERNTLEK